MVLNKKLNVISWILQIVVAVILLQTLFFKFTGATESIYIFSKLGVEPWGRFGSGIVELIASILLFLPRNIAIGAILALGTISGAIFAHLTVLGIRMKEVNDNGELFGLAVVVFLASAVILIIRRHAIPFVGERLFGDTRQPA
ncbi:MAG: DoxX family protein [Acidobacteria bacterium]|nr:DoxX family protein [Acidobacteriota bacterium]